MRKLIAVYGTLKKGFSNHRVMGESKLLGKIRTEPIFTMYSLGGFPALTKDGNTKVSAEVYEVNCENTLNRIYRLEGYTGKRDSPDNWYDTLALDTPFGEAEIFYFKNKSELDYLGEDRIIQDGEWR